MSKNTLDSLDRNSYLVSSPPKVSDMLPLRLYAGHQEGMSSLLASWASAIPVSLMDPILAAAVPTPAQPRKNYLLYEVIARSRLASKRS